MSYEKTIRALSSHFEGRAMSYEKMIRVMSLHFEGMAKSYEKTIRALSLHFEGTAKSYEKTIRKLSMHFEGRYVVSTPYLCNTGLILHWDYPNICSRKRSFRLAQLLVPFFDSITEKVILEDLLAVHSKIVRAGEAGSDADVSEDMHCDESASGVQEGSNDMSSEFDPFLAPTYESEDIADDIEVNEQGERINVVNEPVNVPSPVNVWLLDENMSLTTTLPASRGENVEGGIASGRPQVEPEIRNGFGNKALPSLRLNQWSPKFSGDKQFQNHALVWVRFPWQSLSIEKPPPIPARQGTSSLPDPIPTSVGFTANPKKAKLLFFFRLSFSSSSALEMVVREGNALSFDVVPLLGLLTVTEESRFIMRKGFAQVVSIAIGSTALTTAVAPLSQPIAEKRWLNLRSESIGLRLICTEALPTSVDTKDALEKGEGNVLVKKRSKTIEQAAPISIDEAAGSTGCHLQSPPPVMTTVESTGDCGMDVGPVKKKPDMDKHREIQAIKAGLPNKTCLRRKPGHSSLDVTPGATLPLVSDTVAMLGSHEPIPVRQEEVVPV
ncbi:hypothetical protein IFM89_039111 [Coptis chinensis]|uniref:Uncharacterized protein n=1 Tax=Coptis chinensis TaxID=261450 RepID=A0A835IK16_9MAGN|nr:hypothetical protein IFM89_039111 [Coptis chinensis]